MFKKLFFTENQKALLKECQIANSEEYSQWIIKNVVLPICIIFLPLLIFIIFKTDVKDFQSLILNGSISLLGVNILFGMSSYLIKFQKKKSQGNENAEHFDEEKLNQDMYYLREKLNIYKNILVVIGAAFYIVQKLFHSYNSDVGFYIFSVLTIIILLLSIMIGRFIFIIKDDFFEKTFYGALNKPVLDTRQRWTEKYGK